MDYTVANIYGKIKPKNLSVSVSGSKSITARAMLIAALANGQSILYGVQYSDDCLAFLNCLKSLGIECEAEGTTLKITGCGGKLPVKSAKINVQSAGTAARFITALLAFSEGEFEVDSSMQMKARPVAPLISALKSLGAEFEFLDKQNCFPFIIRGTATPALQAEVDIKESSQFLSALLISSVCAGKPFTVKVSGEHGLDYVNMTLDMMWSFGVTAEQRGCEYVVNGSYTAKRYDIEPDISSACYFYAINKILNTNITVRGVGPHSMQGDIKFIRLLKDFNGGQIDMRTFSDQALTLAAIAPYLDKPTRICGVEHIRRQECDRIHAIVANLTAMGVKCEEFDDGVKIYPSQPKPAKIDTFGDHRVAMSFAVTGLRTDGIVIENAQVCSKTFKDYFEVLDKLCNNLTN